MPEPDGHNMAQDIVCCPAGRKFFLTASLAARTPDCPAASQTTPEGAHVLAERIRATVEQTPFVYNGVPSYLLDDGTVGSKWCP